MTRHGLRALLLGVAAMTVMMATVTALIVAPVAAAAGTGRRSGNLCPHRL